MRLAVVYHRPCWEWQGAIWEAEGAFSRAVEALAAHVDEIDLVVPLGQPDDPANGHRIEATNVRLASLPPWRDLAVFYRLLPDLLGRLWRSAPHWDLVAIRLPTPLGFWAWMAARLRRRPTLLFLVGDLDEVARTVPGTSPKRWLYRLWARLEDRLMRVMARRTLTFANGEALAAKYGGPGLPVVLTTNSTVRRRDLNPRAETSLHQPVRLLCVSRIDPRKGLQTLPSALARLRSRGHECRLTIVGGEVGRMGAEERRAVERLAGRRGVLDSIEFTGSKSIEDVQALEREHDVLLVPSLPGEGVPRVILEAFAASLPVVATNIAGIPGVVCDSENGLLVRPGDSGALADAVARLIDDDRLRHRLIEAGYAYAEQHTVEAQTEEIMRVVRERLFGELTAPHPPPSPRGRGRAEPAASPSGRGRRGAAEPGQGQSSTTVRINIPLAAFNVSGGVKSLCFLGNALARKGHRVRFIVPDYAQDSPVPIDDRVEVRVLSSGPRTLPMAARKMLYLTRLGIVAADDCDICLANYFLTAYAAFASRTLTRSQAALAYNIRGYEPISHGLLAEANPTSQRLRAALARWSYRLPLHKVCTTEWLRDMVGDRTAFVVGHGIDPSVFGPGSNGRTGAIPTPRSDSAVHVGVIGRNGAVKGYGDFLDALNQLSVETPMQVHVAVQEDVSLPNRWPVERSWTPDESAMSSFYHSCDVFVFPSRAEGFGLPALEAMASGCAVLVTDCGGVNTFARPGVNCLMVPPGDPGALAEALAQLVRDPALRVRLAKAGAATAREFSRDEVEERFCAYLLSLAR